jgi:hypothetical protein
MNSGLVILAAAALAAPAGKPAATTSLTGNFPLIELRQYTLYDGERDTLINLFEREFVESQEAQGMKVIGTFRDLDRPNRFVWLRGFKDMDSRLSGLTAFYTGLLWLAHRDEANATIEDSDNVLLLHTLDRADKFRLPGSRPSLGQRAPAGLIFATIEYLKGSAADAAPIFETKVKPALKKRGIRPLASFVTESAANNFPRLPVREKEQVLVWFARFRNDADRQSHQPAMDRASAALASLRAKPPEHLRLAPTARSELR